MGIYLQNNTEFGGQIDVIKKSNHIYGKYNFNSMEIKRMYVSPEVRGQKIGESILSELEKKLKIKYFLK